MEKKANKRQKAIISLSDYNRKQIEDLQQEQKEMTEQFEKRKEGDIDTVTVGALV